MQTFKKVNRIEAQSASRLSEGTLKEEMNDCQPRKERKGNSVKFHTKRASTHPKVKPG